MATRPGTPAKPRGSQRRGPSRRGPARPEFGEERNIEDTVVKLYRCATVVKGGRRFSFGALVVVGDRQGQVGFGYGKANEVPLAVEKGVKQARRAMFRVPLRGSSIPHRVVGHFGASRIVLIPAAEGTGVIAGAAPRAVLELAGVKDVLTKCYGSTSPKNLVKATIHGLKTLRTRAMVESLRGVTLDLPPEQEPIKPAVAERVGEREELTTVMAAPEARTGPREVESAPEPALPEPPATSEEAAHDA